MISNLLMATGSQAPISTVDMVDPFGDGSGIALYKFDGDATDESGTYNGTATNVTYGAGKFGQGIEGGSGKYVTVPINTTTHSMSCWFYLPSLLHSIRSIFSRCGSSYYGFGLEVCPNQVYFDVWSYNANTELSVASKPIIGWNHVYIYFDANGDGFIVLNGTKEIFNLGSIPFAYLTSNLVIGARINFYSTQYPDAGTLIDQFRIFNRALTFEEAIDLYEEGRDVYVAPPAYEPPIGIIPTSNLVAFYPLDTDARDDFSIYEGTASSVTFDGTKAVFNGSSSYISIPAITVGSEFISFSFWIQFNNSGEHVFFDTQLWNSSNGYGFFKKTSNQLAINFKQSGLSTSFVSTASVPIGQVIHLVVVKNAGTCTLYIDGAVFHTSSITNFTAIPAQTGTIGRQYSPAVSYLNGSISRVAIFNKALSQEEVTALYNEGQS